MRNWPLEGHGTLALSNVLCSQWHVQIGRAGNDQHVTLQEIIVFLQYSCKMHSAHLIAGIEPGHCESTPGWDAHQTGAIGHSATVLKPVCSAGVHKPAVQLCEAFQLG